MPATGRREGDRAFGVGRRKTAVARAMMVPGTGKFLIKGRDSSEYLRRPKLIDEIQQPFVLTGTVKRFDVTVAVSGGSLAGQAGAIRLACARALSAWQPEFRAPLSTNGLLTRDPRMVERKKYGIRGARRRPQWTKR
ncbi:MAG: 30S ribosomal protein S9 [Candidatus Coatesbacteria bacterium]